MKTTLLTKGDLRKLNGELKVLMGAVWITRDNDPQDYILGVGDSFSGQGYLLEALTDVSLGESGEPISPKSNGQISDNEVRDLRVEKSDRGHGLTRAGFVLCDG